MAAIHDHKVRLNIVVVYVVSIDVCCIVGVAMESSTHIIMPAIVHHHA